jgi:hypothetical protein
VNETAVFLADLGKATRHLRTDAVMYLTDAATVTGEILYVDGGAHFGRW